MEETWNGFRRLDFTFEGRSAILVLPEKQDKWGNFAMKTEYWDAFPGTEIALLKEGFALAYLKNANRWATPEDCHVRARFVRELSERYGLRDRCVPVGMSCGGAHAVQFAGLHPECVQALFLDAPVLNFCSCPAYLGRQDRLDGALEKEFFAAYPEMTRPQLLSFPWHPINRAPVLTDRQIPLCLVYGTEDQTVPYLENGALLEEAYRAAGAPLLVVPCTCRGHHPHGLPDPAPIVRFLLEHTR